MKEKISIIIPCYNDSRFLPEALERATNQNYDHKEIILVDDGSNAATKKVIAENGDKIDVLVTQKNMGVSAARNNGIRKASGDYILTWDSDDYFEKDFIKKALNFIKDPETVLVSSYSRWFETINERIFKPRGGKLKDALFQNVAMGSAFFRKSDWETVQGYDEKMLKGYEDWEFYLRLLQNGGEVKIIPEVLFHYRNTPGSRNKKANLNRFEILEYIYLKHANLYKNNFDHFVKHILNEQKIATVYKRKIIHSKDYKVGKSILKPFRLLRFFKK
uniref:glycosyltransferase family 2 protein n=1 Tax=uncultured Christiangramia sp. TaxID=503836 RepID=UPI00260CDB5F|nr:glycosyltransferase [uncultured Christiangramia sp.]